MKFYLPPKLEKRGRPKADLTPIGPPTTAKKMQYEAKKSFTTCQERYKQILSWMLPDKLVNKAL